MFLPKIDRCIRFVRGLGQLGPLAAFMVIGPLTGAVVLVATSDHWLPPLLAMDTLHVIPLFFVATVILAGLSLMPTHASSLVAGMMFGGVAGSLLALAATAGAALVGFVCLRRLAHSRAMQELERRPRAAAVHRALVDGKGRVAGLIALIRLSPVMPFAATNLLMAAAGVAWVEFLVGSVAGMTPRVIAVAVAGAGLVELDLSRGRDVRLAVLGAVATLIALFVIGRIARRALKAMIE